MPQDGNRKRGFAYEEAQMEMGVFSFSNQKYLRNPFS